MKQKHAAFTLIELLIVLAILAVLSAIIIPAVAGINMQPGNGKKIGQIVKLSKTGFQSKTWEAELLRGGLTSGSGAIGSAPFDFTVENEEDAKAVQTAMENQTEVVIEYRVEGIYSPFRSSSHGHFLASIKKAKELAVPVTTPEAQ